MVIRRFGFLTFPSHGALNIAFHGGGFHRFAFVVQLLAAANAHQHFGSPFFEVHLSGTSVSPFSNAWLANFLISRRCIKKLARPAWLMVHPVGLQILGNVAAHQPDFALRDAAVGFVERQPASAQTFHLAADQHDAAFERVDHLVFVPCAAVLGDRPLVVVLAVRGGLFFRLFLGVRRGRSCSFPSLGRLLEFSRGKGGQAHFSA